MTQRGSGKRQPPSILGFIWFGITFLTLHPILYALASANLYA